MIEASAKTNFADGVLAGIAGKNGGGGSVGRGVRENILANNRKVN